MRGLLSILALLGICAFAPPGKAQEQTPRAELYGGYDYVRANAAGSSFNFNGGGGELTYNANNWLGFTGDLGGYYTKDAFGAGLFSYLAGPRVTLRRHRNLTPFAQVLFGGARSIDNSPLNAFAMTAGGGLDYRISERLFRFGARLAFRFGWRS